MKQVNTLFRALQSFVCPTEISEILEVVGYRDPARKFTVEELLKYWIVSSIEKWNGFRDSEDKMKSHADLVAVDYSTLSKKASEVTYSFFKELFHLFLGKCNRSTLRKLDLPILATDSTTMTVGAGRLPWAYYRGEKAGVKLHVSFNVASLLPKQVEESVALQHDSEVASKLLTGSTAIFVCDRGYSKYERMDSLQEENHFFVIRLKKNMVIQEAQSLPYVDSHPNILGDVMAYVGTDSVKTKNRFRIVSFVDLEGNIIHVATNLPVKPEIIADLYRARWQVGVSR